MFARKRRVAPASFQHSATDEGLDKTRRGRRPTICNSDRLDAFSPRHNGPDDQGLSLWGSSAASFAEQTEHEEAAPLKTDGGNSSATEHAAPAAAFEEPCAMPAWNAAHLKGARPQDMISSDPAQLAEEERTRRIREFHEHAYLRAGPSPHEAGLEAAGQAAFLNAGMSAVTGAIGGSIPWNENATNLEVAETSAGQGLTTGAELTEAAANSRGDERQKKMRNSGKVAAGALIGGTLGLIGGPAGVLAGASIGGCIAGGFVAGHETYKNAKERQRTGRAHPNDLDPRLQAAGMAVGGALVGGVAAGAAALEAPVLMGAALVGSAAAGTTYLAKKHEQRRENYNREQDAEEAFHTGLEQNVANFVAPTQMGPAAAEAELPALEQASETELEEEEQARQASGQSPVRLHERHRSVS